MNKEKNFVSAVIYVHNSKNTINTFLETVVNTLHENFEHYEVICVNDASDDNSTEIIKKICEEKEYSGITLVDMSFFHGVELSMNAGTDIAIGDYVFEFDDTIPDFDAKEIMKVYERAISGCDIVSACPIKKQRASSSFFYRIFERYANNGTKMRTERFRILSRRVINRVSGMNNMITYRKVVYANSGLKTDCINYEITEDYSEKVGRQEKKYRTSLAMDSLITYTNLGYKVALAMSMMMLASILIVFAYAIIIYIVGSPIEGWTTTIMFLAFCFFGLFGLIAVAIKYLQIIVNLLVKRTKYSFQSINKLSK